MKSIKTFIILIAFIVGSVFTLSAQSRTVSGKVFDEQKEPLVGVTVRTSNAQNGTITSDDGSFSLQVSNQSIVLEFSYIGYQTQNVKVSPSQNNIKVYMAEDAVVLGETVVVGYGTQKSKSYRSHLYRRKQIAYRQSFALAD